MGYRSNVVVVAQFPNKKAKEELLALLSEEQRTLVKGEMEDQGNRLLLQEDYVKWYANRHYAGLGDLGGLGLPNFDDVEAIESLIALADEQAMLWGSSDGTEGIPSVGAFVRVGEENDDTEEKYWGEYDQELDLPEPSDLARLSISIEIDPYGTVGIEA